MTDLRDPDDRITEHFSYSEFACKCEHCDGWPDDTTERTLVRERVARLAESLEMGLRSPLALPMTVISGYRCPRHPLTIARPRSYHARGRAADLKVDDKYDREDQIVYDGQYLAGYADAQIRAGRMTSGGLGTYKNGPRTLHYDDRGHEAKWRH